MDTLMSIVPWGAIIPDDGVMSNSFGDGMMVLPTSLILLSIRLSRLCESSLEMPSAGTRKLNVMGMREVLTKVQWRVLTKPVGTQHKIIRVRQWKMARTALTRNLSQINPSFLKLAVLGTALSLRWDQHIIFAYYSANHWSMCVHVWDYFYWPLLPSHKVVIKKLKVYSNEQSKDPESLKQQYIYFIFPVPWV